MSQLQQTHKNPEISNVEFKCFFQSQTIGADAKVARRKERSVMVIADRAKRYGINLWGGCWVKKGRVRKRLIQILVQKFMSNEETEAKIWEFLWDS